MKIVFGLMFFLFFSSPAMATVYYVSNNGSDANNGSASSPFKTVVKSVSVVKAGDGVRILPGVYKEKVLISGKNGTPSAPIVFVGESTDPKSYPIMDGGDVGYTSNNDEPVFTVKNSSWLVFERLKLINSSESSMFIDASHYVTFRRNIVDYHAYGLLLRNKSSHILMEYNDIYQSYSDNLTWSALKDSKWEGGGFASYGGAGMNVIRNNYFHHSFNVIYMDKDVRIGNYYDANVFIYRNRFENIVDDPYEPETYAFNNHFFENTAINTHRLVSLSPQSSMGQPLGPIYIYNNYQLITKDPSGEAVSKDVLNSMIKLELVGTSSFVNKVYVFNNTADMMGLNANSFGVDVLNSTVKNFVHHNNIYRSLYNAYSKSSLNLVGSAIGNDMSQASFGYPEVGGWDKINPLLGSAVDEDGRLAINSPARGKSKQILATLGFESEVVVNSGDDLGAFRYGNNNFRNSPDPVYVVPPGGEDGSFPANTSWPADVRGGVNPIAGPKWMVGGAVANPTVAAVMIGDANRDSKVDLADFGIWKKEYMLSLSTKSADFNNDSKVDLADFGIWKKNYLGN